MASKKEQEWIIALTSGSIAEATLFTARLQDKGIPARVHQRAAYGFMPVSAGVMSDIEVLVLAPMLEQALAVLKDIGAAKADNASKDES